MPTASLSSINIVGGRTEPEIQGQDVSPFTELENIIRNDKVESNISTDSVLEVGGKAKKTGEKKSKPKSPSTIQTQPISTSHKKIAERNIKNIANMKNILEK